MPWKKFFKLSKLNKLDNFSIVVERIKNLVWGDVRFFTTYADIRHYYTNAGCSGSSCMRYSFNHLPFHPCIAYAQDAKQVCGDDHEGVFNISKGIALAVLFVNNQPVARCIVDRYKKLRGKAQGERASELTKALNDYDTNLEGYINMVRHDTGYIMPYVDGVEFVDTDGELCAGDIPCDITSGTSSAGVYSEYDDTYYPEDEAVWSEVMNSFIHQDDAVDLYEGGVCHRDCDDLHYSEHNEEYFVDTDDWYYLEFKDDYVLVDDVEEICLEYIRRNNSSLNDLVEYCENI
jgi:hypothetical protein